MLCDFFRKKKCITQKKKRKSESPTNVIMFWNPFWSPGLEFLFLTLEAWIWFPQAKVHHETYPPSNKQLPSNSKLCIQNENFPSHHSQSAGSPEFYTTSTINLIGHLQPLHLPHVLRLCLRKLSNESEWSGYKFQCQKEDGHRVVDLQASTALQFVFVQTLVWQQLWIYSFPRVGQNVHICAVIRKNPEIKDIHRKKKRSLHQSASIISTISIISYHVISYHIISYRIISYHIVSYHIISYRIISYHIISYHIISYRIISYHIISYKYEVPLLETILSKHFLSQVST